MIGTSQLRRALTYAARHGFCAGSDESLSRFRDALVRRLVAHAYEFVPHYGHLMREHGVEPADVRCVDDLVHLPITRRDDFQGSSLAPRLDHRVTPDDLVVHRTSGSTGQPLTIHRSWGEERIYGAYRWAVLRQYGYRTTDRHAELEELQPQDNGDSRWLHRAAMAAGLFRQRRIQALQEPDAICRQLAEWRPDVLTGYSGVVSRVAEAVASEGFEIPAPRFVACHSDLVTPVMRRQMSEAFRAPVYELYDAYEVNVVAWQCPDHGALHTADACAVVEVVREGRPAEPGERGEVVLTALHSLAMPFIRYAIGDLATRAAPCPCGRGGSTVQSIDGRTVEYFPLPDGRVVHPYEIYALLGDTAWIRRYQLVQESLSSFRLDVVVAEPIAPARLEEHRVAVAAFLGSETEFEICPVARIGAAGERKQPGFRSLVTSH